jgi:hypothetical protein
MKKSLIALAVSAAVAVPAIAAAEGSVSGDARFRMHQLTGTDDVVDLNESSSNSRVRVKVNGKTDMAYVKARFSTADGTAGGGHVMKSDYGFMGVELGPVTLEGGRIPDNWGNRFRSWDEDWDGIQALFKAGDMDIALWRSMSSEGGPYDAETADDADTSSLGIDVTGKAGMGNFGVRFVSTTSEKGAADASGSEVDGYYNGKIGPGMLIASLVSQSGDLNEDPDGDSPSGAYIHWIQKFGPVTGEIGYVTAQNYFTADDHFALFSTVGTSQDTAVMNFGGMKEISVVALKGTMGVAKGTSVTLGFGAFTGKACDACDDGTGQAIDLKVMHKVSKSTKLYATYGKITIDEDMAANAPDGDVDLGSMGAAMETKF